MSQRCYHCFRPRRLCFCDAIPAINNNTDVIILQHRRERFHPFNSARIVHRALQQSRLLVAHNEALSNQFDAIDLSTKVGLLYPDPAAPILTELANHELPDQIVVIDGTWHHAKTLLRDVPRLNTLPKFRLAPAQPGRYQIRREPNAFALSTLEATASALTSIEPETPGLQSLVDAFERMIADQLGNKQSKWRRNSKRRRGSTNVPRIFSTDASRIVLACGEREPGRLTDRKLAKTIVRHSRQPPVFWVAQRLDGSDRFECLLESEHWDDPTFRIHTRVNQDRIETAVSVETFRNRWQAFLRDDDHLVVDLQGTAELLRNCDAVLPPFTNFKSIQMGPDVDGAQSYDTATIDDAPSLSRAQTRLAELVAKTESLVSSTHPE